MQDNVSVMVYGKETRKIALWLKDMKKKLKNMKHQMGLKTWKVNRAVNFY